ncbi:LysE family translocator [Larsenimonas salina]|uniref:LysE family translocator n=1 Tax=Larsenimonas salina TaxID=1295565 RepID=UPI002073768D|nr:LysE family translocator [Larsenimonas salina]MCM5704592.1 LysE family translocator [Larsenimonas salina]
MTQGWSEVVGMAFVASGAPGPVNLVAAMAGSRVGWRAVAGYALGAASGFVALLWAAYLGLSALVLHWPWIQTMMMGAACVYVLWLALQLLRADPRSGAADAHAPSLREGALTQWLNPKAWAVALSLVALFSTPEGTEGLSMLSLSGIYLVVCLSCVLLWARLGSALMSHPRWAGWFNRLMAIALMLMLFWLLREAFK